MPDFLVFLPFILASLACLRDSVRSACCPWPLLPFPTRIVLHCLAYLHLSSAFLTPAFLVFLTFLVVLPCLVWLA